MLVQARQSDEESSQTTPVPQRAVSHKNGDAGRSGLSSLDHEWMVSASAGVAASERSSDSKNLGVETDDEGLDSDFTTREVIWERRGLFLDRLCSELVER
jgi:hypothetical protein